jgi:hypothetical protein
MRNEIRIIGDLQRLILKPGDVFLLTVPGDISKQDEEDIRRALERELPGHKVIVISGGIKFDVIDNTTAVNN